MTSKESSKPRHINRTESEAKESIKVRNLNYCRKNRKKWRESDKEMEELYRANEKRIKQLEGQVEKLSKQLK